MTVITLLTAGVVFAVMERHIEGVLTEGLQETLSNSIEGVETEIQIASARTASLAATPILIDLLQLVNADIESASVRQTFNTIVQGFVGIGHTTATAVYANNRRELARAGVFAQHPKLIVPLNNLPGSAQLIWDEQLFLRTVLEVKKEERVVGTIMMETRLPAIMDMIMDPTRLGETGDMALCSRYELGMGCLPTTLSPKTLIIPLRKPDGTLLPTTHALEGRTGFVIAKDYRLQTVVAAYAPVGDLGLGMVLKVDRAELLAPSLRQLLYLIPLLAGMVILALLLLRWLLTPLVIGLTNEVANRKQAEASLRDGMASLSATTETALGALVQMDKKGMITKWSNKAEEIFGWLQAEAIGQNLGETIVPLQYREAHRRGLKHFLATGEGPVLNKRIEITGLHRNGHEFPMELSIGPFKMDGEYVFSAFIRDISETKVAEDKIIKLAFYDDLTGLPNRRMFYDKLEDEMKRSDRSGLPVVLMMLDLDHFKEVNDTLGHTQGDILLVEVARRITACVRETDTVARLGGDEFTIILSEMKDVTKANHIAQSIIKSLTYPFQLSEDTAVVSGSLGVALYPNDAQNADNLIVNADQAMYVAKDAGRNRFGYFTAALQEAAHARQSLISDLRDALPGKQFALHYQPIVELATGKIYKAEALLRWQHPERGLVSPAEFIPVAEESGLIHEIGDWVFYEAIRKIAHWREMFEPELQISLNVSPVQFRESQRSDRGSLKGFKENWLNQLDRLDLPGESVVFEITEGVLLNELASARDKLLAMRDAGIQVALDDFGTGYSSLSYLKKFDIDYLKIDQSFVRNLENDSIDQALCEAIIVMAHKLGLKVIAEGVETESQRDLLVGFGCEHAQGWLFSKALPADEFEVLLKEQGKGAQIVA
jgi:diguanylate cyclase (GGDEF)-like protein/PAS domain S-box-containing protein